MPNIASVLKDEITRLARKELRNQTEGLKKASTQHRGSIASLKRQVTKLERQVSLLEGQLLKVPSASSTEESTANVRFTAKGLRSQRKRLGLSAADYAKLIGVTPQSIYSWESETTSPRKAQVAALASIRGLGKKEVQARLAQLAKKTSRKKTR